MGADAISSAKRNEDKNEWAVYFIVLKDSLTKLTIDCIYVSRNCVNNNNGVVRLRMACVSVDLYCELRNISLFWYTENPFEKWFWAHL